MSKRRSLQVAKRSDSYTQAAASSCEYSGYAAKYYRPEGYNTGKRSRTAAEIAIRKRARRRAMMVRKTVFTFMAALILFSAGLCLGNTHAGAANQPVNKYYTNVMVQKGDTIWTLADNYINGYKVDKNKYVKEIMQMNNLPNAEIHVGDCITMVYYSTEVK